MESVGLNDCSHTHTHTHKLAFSQSDGESVITGLERNDLTKKTFGEPRACLESCSLYSA